ncbi:MAG: MFS transporter [Solirubrobacterales bacterium]
MSMLRRIAVDTSALKESRDFRLLTLGNVITGVGAQAALVALPYQTYVETRSALTTGMLGLAELIPLIVFSLYAGVLNDRHDRRKLLILVQLVLVSVAATLAIVATLEHPPIWLLFVLAGATAGAASLERVTRTAIVPNTVRPGLLRSALSITFGLYQLVMVVGPAIGGLLIAGFGIVTPYVVDAVSCLGMVGAALLMSPQPPHARGEAAPEHEPALKSIREGLRFVRKSQALMASFIIDLAAMTFGMPRALFPVLSLSVFHAGASGTGFLYAAVSLGATIAALTTGWLEHARWLGRIVIVAVAVWGAAIAAAGFMNTIYPALLFFAIAGAADSVSAVCRSTISQSVTPEHMRGRMSSVFMLVVAGGPRLGDAESGSVAAAFSPRVSVVSGGLLCIASAALVAVALPGLAAYDGDKAAPVGDDALPEPLESPV